MSPANAPVNPHNYARARPQLAIPTHQPHPHRDGSAMKSQTYASTKTKPPPEPAHLSIEVAAKIFAVTLSPAGVSRLCPSKSPR